MIDKLIRFFKKPTKETKGETPEGLCANCWGEQEYDNMIREMYFDKQIDINNYSANHSFIKEFVVNKIDGIRLVKGNSAFECPTCKSRIAN